MLFNKLNEFLKIPFQIEYLILRHKEKLWIRCVKITDKMCKNNLSHTLRSGIAQCNKSQECTSAILIFASLLRFNNVVLQTGHKLRHQTMSHFRRNI